MLLTKDQTVGITFLENVIPKSLIQAYIVHFEINLLHSKNDLPPFSRGIEGDSSAIKCFLIRLTHPIIFALLPTSHTFTFTSAAYCLIGHKNAPTHTEKPSYGSQINP